MRRYTTSSPYHAFIEAIIPQLYEAQVLLRNGTQDLPRMTRVLQNERVSRYCPMWSLTVHSYTHRQVFLLVNEETVKRFKTNLADEIEPAISELIERAEQGLVTLEKKQQLLETKVGAAIVEDENRILSGLFRLQTRT